MSVRYPHYVHYYELVPKVFQANAGSDSEAIDDFHREFDMDKGHNVQIRYVTTEEKRNESHTN